MNQLILTTVGTSLLNNARRAGIETEPSTLLSFLKSDLQKASAETNSLSRLMGKNDEVVLIHSHTPEGETCAKVLLSYLESQSVRARKHEVQQLQYDEGKFVRLGLKNLVQTLSTEIRKSKNSERKIIINATGGFKAEIAYATAVGMLFRVEVCYIHETFGDIVTLPVTPIGWDMTLIAKNEEFFDWIDEEPRSYIDVKSRLYTMPDEVSMLLEDEEDGFVYLSAMGEAYVAAFRQRIDESSNIPLFLSKSAWHDWEKMPPSNQQLYRRQFGRLRVPEIRNRVVELIPPSDALIFPQGNIDERIFFTEKEGKIYLLELTSHTKRYQMLIKKGVKWHEYQDDDFTELI